MPGVCLCCFRSSCWRSGRNGAAVRPRAQSQRRAAKMIPGSRRTWTSWSRFTRICTLIRSFRVTRSRRRSESPLELTKAGAAVTTNVGKLGVVGVMKNGEGPVVLVRTDMDALPVVEETGLAYASKVKTRDKIGSGRRRDARLRPRHPHDELHRHRPAGWARIAIAGRVRSFWSANPLKKPSTVRTTCSRTGFTRGFPSPTLRWHCTAGRTSRSGRCAIAPGRRSPARLLSPSRFAAREATAPGRTARLIRSCWRRSSSSTCRRLSAARSSRASRRS